MKPLPPLPEDLDGYLAEQESRFDDITPGAEKSIVWADAPGRQADLAVIYLHGFSATRQEVAPLCDKVAAHFGANLFYSRLRGHGRGCEAMREATLRGWLEDAQEAYRIGQRLGKRLIVIGNSTGATLATWLALNLAEEQELAGLILMAPNFGLQHPLTHLLDWPIVGGLLAETVIGKYRQWQPDNELHARYWTYIYPSRALVPMMALVKQVSRLDLGKLQAPTQLIYSPKDQVINSQAVERFFEKIGSPKKELRPFLEAEDPRQHILAGDILSPGATAPISQLICDFIERHS